MGLDLGDARIGIAFSDLLGIIANGYETYTKTRSIAQDIKYLAKLAKDRECKTVVIGLPLNMDGTKGEKAIQAEEFGEKFKTYLGPDITVVFQDERLSTVSATKFLIESGMRREKRKEIVDKIAAAIILQSYLDKINKEGVRNE